MIFIYILFNVVSILLSKLLYRKIVNPVSLYSVVWAIAVLIHQSGLIIYYEMEPFTWFVIFFLQSIFVAASFFGWRIKCLDKVRSDVDDLSKNRLIQKKIEKYIVLTSVISGIAIIGDFFIVVSVYGRDVLNHITDIYSDRVHQNVDLTTIPYLGSFVFIATSLAGAYSKKYGFKLIVFLPLVLGGIRSLTTGGRAGLIFIMIIFVFSYLCYPKPYKAKGKILALKNSNIVLLLGGAFLIFVAFLITVKRSASGATPYATERFRNLFGENAVVYNFLTYVGSPIGALNEYLRTCDFNFGQNTFLSIFNVLARLGVIDRIDQYQEFFFTPESCNVATWLRELIEDFTLVGATIVVIFFGAVTSFVYKKAKVYQSIRNGIVWSILAVVVALSFFDWRLRNAEFWISLFFGYLIGRKIDRTCN